MKPYRLVAVFVAVLALAGASIGAVFAASPSQVADDSDAAVAETKPYIGVRVAPLNDRLRERLEIPDDVDGLLVVSVDADGPAGTAGIERLSVITQANEAAVTEPKALQEIVAGLSVGSVLTVTVYQDNALSDVVVSVGERSVHSKREKPLKDRILHGIGGFLRGHKNAIDVQVRTMDEDGAVHTHKVTLGTVTTVGDASVTVETINGETYTAQIGEDTVVSKNGRKAELADIEAGDKATILESDGVVKAVIVGKPKVRPAAGQRRPLPPQAQERIGELRERFENLTDDDIRGLQNRFRELQRQVDRRFDRLERFHRPRGGENIENRPAAEQPAPQAAAQA